MTGLHGKPPHLPYGPILLFFFEKLQKGHIAAMEAPRGGALRAPPGCAPGTAGRDYFLSETEATKATAVK